uniref:Transposase n=1 Tax=Mesocestoides corti TaxID=53468 RepID=A0A5K3FRQ7_MESCO
VLTTQTRFSFPTPDKYFTSFKLETSYDCTCSQMTLSNMEGLVNSFFVTDIHQCGGLCLSWPMSQFSTPLL